MHNARIGGAPFSQHLAMAADLSTVGRDRYALQAAALKAGFSGFGYYTNFLHVDEGRARFWYGGKSARAAWQQ